LLTACGFQLRGQEDYAFKRLAIVGATAPVAARLKRMIQGGIDTVIVAAAANADAILTISEGSSQSVLTFDTLGVASEYELIYSLSYHLVSSDGNVLIPPSEIRLNRSMTYSDQYSTAKATESTLLYADMQNDAVDQLTRRLSIVHSLHPGAGQQVPAVVPAGPLPPPPL
jgi:LPS-assembly lipoprotein